MLSYKAIIEKFEEFAEAHYIIESYGTGEAWQIIEHNKQANRKYPMMWVQDLPFSTTGSIGTAGVTTYAFRVYFLQQVPTLKNTTLTTLEQANVVRAKSDMLQCAQDIQSYWAQDHVYDELDLDKNTLATPFHDILNDSLTGFFVDIKLEQAFSYNSCAIPMSGVTPPDSPIVTITINGVSFTTVDCGLTEDIIVKDTSGTVVGNKVGNEWIVPIGGGGSVTYDILVNSVDTGQDLDMDGTNHDININ